MKLLLDTGSDISIMNEQTWKKISCLTLRGTKKIARCVSGIKNSKANLVVTYHLLRELSNQKFMFFQVH